MQAEFAACGGVIAELKAITNLIKRRMHGAADPEAIGLTRVQGLLLGYLAHNRHRDIYQRDVEVELGIRRSTATRLLQALEKKGLLVRENDQQDGRLKRLVLTPKALGLSCGVEEELNEVERQLLKGISPQEQREFMRILGRIRGNAEMLGGGAEQ